MRVNVIVATLSGCPADVLDDADALADAVRRAVAAGEFELLHLHLHRFDPQGVTASAVLAESHINLHSWPEEGTLFVDVATCSGPVATRRAFDALCAAIPHTQLRHQTLESSGAEASPRGALAS